MFAIFKGILRDALDADGKKIVNLATPTQDADAANKGYVDSHAGGSPSWDNITGKPTTFPPSLHTHSQSQVTGLADALAAKRDLTDMESYANPPRYGVIRWTSVFEDHTQDSVFTWDEDSGRWTGGRIIGNDSYIVATGPRSFDLHRTSDGSKIWQWTGLRTNYAAFEITGIADKLALVSQLPTTNQLLTAEQRDEIAKVKDKADEFTEWDITGTDVPPGEVDLKFISPVWVLFVDGDITDVASQPSTVDAVACDGFTDYNTVTEKNITAIRKRVLRTGDAATTNDLTAAISTNNPAFVSAVRSTPPDPETPWGTYGTLGAAIAGIIAALATKLTKGLDAQGVPTDANVAELFSESGTSTAANPDLNNKVLQAAVNKLIDVSLPIPLSAKTGNFTTESYKRFTVASMPSAGLTLTMHTPTGTNADVFECRFDGTALTADASVTFTGATVTKMEGETDTGVVKAGKVALMSAFWNGATWDVNWKVEG